MLRDALPVAAEAWRVWLDTLVERELLRLRARFELSLDEWRGLYISDAQVDALLQPPGAAEADAARIDALTAQARAAWPALQEGGLAARLGARLALDEAELALLLLALAPDLDPRYEALYAYLNDDAAHRLPSLDLARRLLQGLFEDGLEADVAALASPAGTLVDGGLLELIEPAEPRSRWRRELRAAELVVQLAQGLPLADPRWQHEAAWTPAPLQPPRLGAEPLVHVAGEDAEDRRQALQAWAGERGLPVLRVPSAVAAAHGRSLLLAARLAGAALAIDDEDAAGPPGRVPLGALAGRGVPLAVLAAAGTP
ncbi:hypothetical protein V4F39_20785, partial [Aquincola sp. MAHUQ-54]